MLPNITFAVKILVFATDHIAVNKAEILVLVRLDSLNRVSVGKNFDNLALHIYFDIGMYDSCLIKYILF